jgi:phage gpG-like protein
LQHAPTILGNDAVNFFLDSFKKQGWLGNSFTPWPARKIVTRWGKTKRNNGRAILIDSGRLRRSIRVTSATSNAIKIGTDVPYAKAHNEGTRIRGVIQQVSAHTRKKTRAGITSKKTLKTRSNITFGRINTGASIQVKAHTRRIDMRLPKRQFMGYSPYLDKALKRRLMAELMKVNR